MFGTSMQNGALIVKLNQIKMNCRMKPSPSENKNKTSKQQTRCLILFYGMLVLVIYLFLSLCLRKHTRPSLLCTVSSKLAISFGFCKK